MSQSIIALTLWFAAIGAGLMAGVYFAFSAFIMTALARLPDASGVAAMQSINRVILRSLFMPLFFATTIASLALAVVAVLRWGEPGAVPMLAGGVTYVVGMFLCTAVCNVPLNNALDVVDPAGAEAEPMSESLPDGLDALEPCPHHRLHACLRAVHRSDRRVGESERRCAKRTHNRWDAPRMK